MASARPARISEPPILSRRLFWAIVGTCVGLFALESAALLVLRVPTKTLMGDGSLLRTLALEALLAAAWIPVLGRRGWSLRVVTAPAETLDVARGVGLVVVSYAAYVFAFILAVVALPRFVETAGNMEIGGELSWWVVILVSVFNPLAEEFLYLGFITNVLARDGFQAALLAGILARVVVHVYQGPAGLVSAIAFGAVSGVYYLRSGRLWPVVAAHGLADLLALGRLAGGVV